MALRTDARLVHVIEAINPEWQRLAHMTDHDLQLRIAIENSDCDQAQEMQAGFHPETEDRAVEARLEHRPDHRIRGRRRVDVEWLAGIGQRAENRIESRMVEILALRMAVDLDAFESQLLCAADDLGRRPFRVLR